MWKLQTTIVVYDKSLGMFAWGSKRNPYKLYGAYFFVQRARDEGRPVTFEASGPDAARAIEIIEEICADPPRHLGASREFTGMLLDRIFGRREEEA